MSDVSVLSHEYKTASDLSEATNRALIALKTVRQRLPGVEAITDDQLDASRRFLAGLIEALIGLLNPDGSRHVDDVVAARVPESLVVRLRSERRGDLAYYLDDLKRVAARLRDGTPKLADEDIALLDQIATAADTETSNVFRRLMRK
jgi:hypothetical protein